MNYKPGDIISINGGIMEYKFLRYHPRNPELIVATYAGRYITKHLELKLTGISLKRTAVPASPQEAMEADEQQTFRSMRK